MEITDVHRPCKKCGNEIGNSVFMLCDPCWNENFKENSTKTLDEIKDEYQKRERDSDNRTC